MLATAKHSLTDDGKHSFMIYHHHFLCFFWELIRIRSLFSRLPLEHHASISTGVGDLGLK